MIKFNLITDKRKKQLYCYTPQVSMRDNYDDDDDDDCDNYMNRINRTENQANNTNNVNSHNNSNGSDNIDSEAQKNPPEDEVPEKIDKNTD